MAKAVRLEDIAKKLGVSIVTISKALSNKEGVSEELRTKIKELADVMGYKGKKSDESSTNKGDIGIIIPARFIDKNSSFYWEMYERLISWLSTYGYYGILEIMNQEDESQLELPRVVKDGKVEGVIVVGQAMKSYMKLMQESDIPTIFLDAYDSSVVSDAIISDGFYGMYLMTNYLLERGHKDICFVGTPSATSSICDRYFGFARAMYERGLPVNNQNVIHDRDNDTTEIKITLPKTMPTAFACNCDLIAYYLILVLNEHGYRVPDDVSVVGFDNYMVSEIANPKITTYEVDINNMAKACASRIVKKVQNQSYQSGVKIVVGRVIERDSVKDLRENTGEK